MALDSETGSVSAEQGETTMRANFIHQIEFDGDAAYAAGGSANFQQFVRDVTGEEVTISGVVGYSVNAGGTALVHIAHYDVANDKLQAFAVADGAQATGDISANTFHLTVFSR